MPEISTETHISLRNVYGESNLKELLSLHIWILIDQCLHRASHSIHQLVSEL